MTRLRQSFMAVVVACVLMDCGGSHTRSVKGSPADLVGGTPASAGYIYSKLFKDYVRPFEVGVQVLSATDSTATSAGYILFSRDSARAELFLAEDSVPLLDRCVKGGDTVSWRDLRSDPHVVERIEKGWIVERDGRLLYTSTGMQTTVSVNFAYEGNKGALSACFFNLYGLVQLHIGSHYALLRQYVTASGYGYQNQQYDLRGKGSEATLTDKVDRRSILLIQQP